MESWRCKRTWTRFNNRAIISSLLSNTVVERRLLACWLTLYLQARPLPWSIHHIVCRARVSPSMFSSFEISKSLQRGLSLSIRLEWNNRGERFTFRFDTISSGRIIFSWIPPRIQGWDSTFEENWDNILQNDICDLKRHPAFCCFFLVQKEERWQEKRNNVKMFTGAVQSPELEGCVISANFTSSA